MSCKMIIMVKRLMKIIIPDLDGDSREALIEVADPVEIKGIGSWKIDTMTCKEKKLLRSLESEDEVE